MRSFDQDLLVPWLAEHFSHLTSLQVTICPSQFVTDGTHKPAKPPADAVRIPSLQALTEFDNLTVLDVLPCVVAGAEQDWHLVLRDSPEVSSCC